MKLQCVVFSVHWSTCNDSQSMRNRCHFDRENVRPLTGKVMQRPQDPDCLVPGGGMMNYWSTSARRFQPSSCFEISMYYSALSKSMSIRPPDANRTAGQTDLAPAKRMHYESKVSGLLSHVRWSCIGRVTL